MKYLCLSLIFLSSCAQVTSLNLKKHEFGIVPTKIIWFQVEGLDEEQLALLRFHKNSEERTSFEQSMCMGNTWGYDLYNIRPSASKTFLAQMTGKKNITDSCEDLKLKPIWNYLSKNEYHTGILESGANDNSNSIIKMKSCKDSNDYFKNLYMWSMSTVKAGGLQYHYSEEVPLNNKEVLYDRSCGQTGCFATVLDNFRSITDKMNRVHHKYMLIIRDFSYAKSVKSKNYKNAKTILSDLEKTYEEALKMVSDDPNLLVLLTTSNSQLIQFPNQGREWYEFEKNNKAQPHRTKLTNLVLASGARSENFCGIYEEAQLFERILSGPKQQGLEFKFINPFN